MLKSLDEDTQKLKDKILSSLNLEKKRLVLSEKDRFVQAVIARAQEEAAGFRASPDYPAFLEKAVLEGIAVIADSRIEVHYSSLDEKLINEGFIRKIEAACAAGGKKQCALKFHKADFQDIGVIVYSADGRMMFDNRFSARLARMKDELYMNLLNE